MFTLRTLTGQLGEWQWVCYRLVQRPSGTTKVPYHPAGRVARVDDARTWSSFAACSVAAAGGDFDGIGYVLTGDVVAIDLDHVIPVGETSSVRAGDLTPLPDWARWIVYEMKTYIEISQSGCGLHLLARGSLLAGSNRRGQFEIYDRGRYIALTGDCISRFPITIEPRQAEVDTVIARMLPPRPSMPAMQRRAALPTRADAAVLERARSAKNGAKFTALYDRGVADGDDHSSADLTLVRMLRYWTGNDAAQIDRLFRSSALMRAKWDERRGETTYGAMTIAKAMRS